MRKRPYVQWERQARVILRGYDGPEFQVFLEKPLARALHQAFVRGYARAAYRRRGVRATPDAPQAPLL